MCHLYRLRINTHVLTHTMHCFIARQSVSTIIPQICTIFIIPQVCTHHHPTGLYYHHYPTGLYPPSSLRSVPQSSLRSVLSSSYHRSVTPSSHRSVSPSSHRPVPPVSYNRSVPPPLFHSSLSTLQPLNNGFLAENTNIMNSNTKALNVVSSYWMILKQMPAYRTQCCSQDLSGGT